MDDQVTGKILEDFRKRALEEQSRFEESMRSDYKLRLAQISNLLDALRALH